MILRAVSKYNLHPEWGCRGYEGMGGGGGSTVNYYFSYYVIYVISPLFHILDHTDSSSQ